jgi:hypothetical protein
VTNLGAHCVLKHVSGLIKEWRSQPLSKPAHEMEAKLKSFSSEGMIQEQDQRKEF